MIYSPAGDNKVLSMFFTSHHAGTESTLKFSASVVTFTNSSPPVCGNTRACLDTLSKRLGYQYFLSVFSHTHRLNFPSIHFHIVLLLPNIYFVYMTSPLI